MRRSIKSYMLIDLAMITVIGCILEGAVTYMSGLVFNSVPTVSISLLIVLLALARWNQWGLLTVPFLAAATIIGGRLSPISYFRAAYEWRAYLSIVIGFMFTGLSVIVFKKKGTKMLKENYMIALYVIANYIIYNVAQLLIYNLLCNIFNSPEGWNLVTYTSYANSTDGEQITTNISRFMVNGFGYNLFGLIIGIVGGIVLRAQGAFGNVAEKLLEDKRLAEEIRRNDEEFSIPDIDEVEEEENKSEALTDESNNQKEESSDTIDS
ncbi:MAG: hypothetical protein K6A63_03060 [Acholeplasmatales bacterium]|nr:hypothetical protein [Acholeplasmatales bacterium]